MERARRQVTELENRLTQRVMEFESYKERVHTHPESHLQTELGLLKLEKVSEQTNLMII